jgi:DHA3 family macrolide efflux protein-like MFS transporter
MAGATTPDAPPPPLTRNTAFLILTGGQFVSRAGDALLALAAVWLVLELTDNNPLASSAALTFEFLPYIFFGLLAGVFVDRWDRRRTMMVADTVRGAVLLVIPALHATGRLEVWHVFAVSFVLSSLGRLFIPARQALIPDLVASTQLVRANAISEGSGQVALVFGPALGGVLLSTFGAVNLYYLDAASFFISALSLLFVRPQRTKPPASRGGLWREAAGGLRHVLRTPLLAAALLLSVVGTWAFAPVPALLPVLVRGDLAADGRTFGMLMACFFIGSVAGSAAVGRLGERLHRGRALLAGILGVGVFTLGLALAPVVAAAAAALALTGGAAAGFNVAEYSLLQQQTPADLRGRVFAVANVSAQFLRPLALILAGVLAQLAGVRVALAVMALFAIAAAGVGTTRAALRNTA